METGDTPKGDVITAARLAGIMAAKRTSELLPFCHPLPIHHVDVSLTLDQASLIARAEVTTIATTGVEMEALTAVSGALLSAYDMLKFLDEPMRIEAIQLEHKRGGKSDWPAPAPDLRAAVLTVSDRVSAGVRLDKSGPAAVEILRKAGIHDIMTAVVPDEPADILRQVESWINQGVNLVITSGGTGIAPRDRTPETLEQLLTQRLPGVEEAIRSYGRERLPTAMLSRSLAGLAGKTMLLALPGSTGGVTDGLRAVIPGLWHVFEQLEGQDHPTP